MPPLTRNQVRGFWAAWAGWTLDGMDSFIYALVLVPALRDLLPRSGIAATQANIGFYGGVLFAIFLTGWGFAFLWGPIADRFGRVRTLVFTILCYSLFTFLGCAAASVWQLALCRFLAGAGIGGEWTLGGVFVAEEWPESRRVQGAAWMHTGYYFGTFLAAVVNYTVGAHYGWRAAFAVGGTPALLVAFIRYGVAEPKRWQHRVQQLDRAWGARDSFYALFSPEYRRRTIVNAALLFVSMVGLWAGSAYVPSSVTFLGAREGLTTAAAARMASYATMLLSTGTIIGCLLMPLVADRLGRRVSLALYFLLMFACISTGFGYLFYLPSGALPRFLICLFFPRDRRRQLRGLYLVAARAVPHRMPRQRLRLRDFVRPVYRRRRHVPGRRRSLPHAHYRDSRGTHFARVPDRPRAPPMGRRDARKGASRLNLTHLFDLSLIGRRDSPALEFQGKVLTFGELDLRSNRLANLFAGRGLRAADRLCVYLPNCVEMIDVYLACIKLGVIFVPINILYRGREIAHILQRCRAVGGDLRRHLRITRPHLERHRRSPRMLPDSRPPDRRSRSRATRRPGSSIHPAPPASPRAPCSRTTTSPPTR